MVNPYECKPLATVHETILAVCRKFPDKTALKSAGENGNGYDYAEVAGLILEIASELRATGLKRGDRIGLLAENCPEWGVFYLAVLYAGGIIVPLDCALKTRELAGLMRISEITTVVCSDKKFETAVEIITLNDLSIAPLQLTALVRKPAGKPLDLPALEPPSCEPDDTAALIYTSGTTGDPKGVILTHRNLTSNMENMVHSMELYQEDVFFSVLPLHHTFEATAGMLLPLFVGLTIVYSRSLKSRDIMDDIKNHQATCMVAVPLLYEKMYNAIRRRIAEQPPLRRISLGTMYQASKVGWKFKMKAGRTLFKSLREKAGLGSMRLFVSGGAPLPARVGEWFNLMGFTLIEGYGLTECSPVVAVNRPDDIRFGSVGPPLANTEAAIHDPTPDGIGEIIIKTPSATPGYLDNPGATAELRKDEWLFTGDLGKIENGHLYITGRKKNLIVSGAGKNIYPEEIEAELGLSPYISEALVLGRKHTQKAGEEVCALIVPDFEQLELSGLAEEGKPSAKEIRDIIAREVAEVNHRLADFKRITTFEIQYDELEKTSTKKIKRNLYQ
ncbi:MAG: long-chain fatty acid--CoA ligase [candidate division Zixibacteria bacterium]|nr:long-chain fatty acid--CoA ligase [candidate division Zixibacteria bacterium]